MGQIFQMDYRAVLILQTIIVIIGNGCDGRMGEYKMIPGAVVENSGLVHLVDEKIEVIIMLDPLKTVADTLGRHLNNLGELKKQIANDITLNDTQREYLDNCLQPTVNMLKQVIGDKGRVKRGLLNFVGEISNILFRIVDDNTLNNRLNQYTDVLNTVKERISMSLTTINQLNDNDVRLGHLFSDLNKHMFIMSTRLNNILHFTTLGITISNYNLGVSNIIQHTNILLLSIAVAAKGIASPSLLNIIDINNIKERL